MWSQCNVLVKSIAADFLCAWVFSEIRCGTMTRAAPGVGPMGVRVAAMTPIIDAGSTIHGSACGKKRMWFDQDRGAMECNRSRGSA